MKYEKYVDNIPCRDKVCRALWGIVSLIIFKPFAGRLFNPGRIFVLRCFGANIAVGGQVYSSALIPAPWNLDLGIRSTIGPHVRLHIGKVRIGNKVTISQYSYLCTGSHEITSRNLPYFSKPIVIEDFAWVAADAFIASGVTIGEGAVVGARAVVTKDVPPDSIFVWGGAARKIVNRFNDLKEIEKYNQMLEGDLFCGEYCAPK
jgi:putative colanic acid biosynthesis acetyltransferase WcaF